MELHERLFQAIKKDNLKEFNGCMEQSNCGSLRLGRFPVLSVMYLYNSRRLLHAYEKSFLKHNSWQDVGEPVEISAKFRDVAGKCLRIYLTETVSPAEMLLLMDRNRKLTKVFAQAHVTPPVKQRLKDIYFVKWGLQAEFVLNRIVLERRPLTRAEKLRWIISAVCVVLCVAIAVGTPFVVNAFSPFITDGSGVINVSRWQQIRFGSGKVYALNNDVTLPQDFYIKEMNCQLRGNGHTVTVTGNGVFGDINGALSDVVFETNGSPIAQNITMQAKVENVQVNATLDAQTSQSCGLFATNNYGNVTAVTLNVSGKLYAAAVEQGDDTRDEQETPNCGGLVAKNGVTTVGNTNYLAVVQDCVVNFDNFNLQGELHANAAFGGIVGVNDGLIQDCTTNGAITAEMFDVAGICSENNHALVSSENNADITQTAHTVGWSPLSAGIVITNYFAVEECVNNGNITSTSDALVSDTGTSCVYASGIAFQNINGRADPYAYLQDCVNNGNVTASATYIDVSAVGLCSETSGPIHTSVNNGAISASGSRLVEAAGVVSVAYGYVYRSVNEGEVEASGDELHVGGIVATSYAQVLQCLSTGKISATGKTCYVGGIAGCLMGIESKNNLHCGTVESCIAQCEINATKNTASDSFAAVGGVVGYMEEYDASKFDTDYAYVGGNVIYSYFNGSLQASAGAYVGGVVGVAGNNLYRQSVGNDEGFFLNNVYADNCGASLAFGGTKSNGSIKQVDDVGAQRNSPEEIEEDSTYLKILEFLGR